MQGWIESDAAGREVLVRTGTGVVTAIVLLGVDGDGPAQYRVEIYCDAPHGRPGAIRYSAHPTVPSGHPLLAVAQSALDEVWAVAWTIQWHRHEWVPDELPIMSLNLASDARNVLVELERVIVPEAVDALGAIIDDFAAGDWGR